MMLCCSGVLAGFETVLFQMRAKVRQSLLEGVLCQGGGRTIRTIQSLLRWVGTGEETGIVT